MRLTASSATQSSERICYICVKRSARRSALHLQNSFISTLAPQREQFWPMDARPTRVVWKTLITACQKIGSSHSGQNTTCFWRNLSLTNSHAKWCKQSPTGWTSRSTTCNVLGPLGKMWTRTEQMYHARNPKLRWLPCHQPSLTCVVLRSLVMNEQLASTHPLLLPPKALTVRTNMPCDGNPNFFDGQN